MADVSAQVPCDDTIDTRNGLTGHSEINRQDLTTTHFHHARGQHGKAHAEIHTQSRASHLLLLLLQIESTLEYLFITLHPHCTASHECTALV